MVTMAPLRPPPRRVGCQMSVQFRRPTLYKKFKIARTNGAALKVRGAMSTKSVEAWQCDRAGCGHVWLSKEKPKRCAKCKSPAWDKAALAQTAEQGFRKPQVGGATPPGGSKIEIAPGADPTVSVLRTENTPAREMVGSNPATRSARTKPGAPVHKCPFCGKATIEWGAGRRCAGCNRNY